MAGEACGCAGRPGRWCSSGPRSRDRGGCAWPDVPSAVVGRCGGAARRVRVWPRPGERPGRGTGLLPGRSAARRVGAGNRARGYGSRRRACDTHRVGAHRRAPVRSLLCHRLRAHVRAGPRTLVGASADHRGFAPPARHRSVQSCRGRSGGVPGRPRAADGIASALRVLSVGTGVAAGQGPQRDGHAGPESGASCRGARAGYRETSVDDPSPSSSRGRITRKVISAATISKAMDPNATVQPMGDMPPAASSISPTISGPRKPPP
jgi:hypothetical protein